MTKKGRQVRIDVATIVFAIFLIVCCVFGVSNYLSELAFPYPYVLMIVVSVLLSFYYNLKSSFDRQSLYRCLTSLSLFTMSSVLAIYARDGYDFLIVELEKKLISMAASEVLRDHEISDVLIYLSAIKNKVIGVGACFFGCLGLSKLFLSSFINSLYLKFLYVDIKEAETCSECGQEITIKD